MEKEIKKELEKLKKKNKNPKVIYLHPMGKRILENNLRREKKIESAIDLSSILGMAVFVVDNLATNFVIGE